MKYLILFLSLSIYFLASCSNKKKSTTTAVPIKPSGIVTPLPGETVEPTIGLNLGNHSPEIAQNNLNDSIIKLSSLKGKLVLIDFWASWCAPCRKELPNVKRAYEKYKNKGFEILGVSLDKDRDAWIEAISKEGLTWPQVSDLKFWQSEAVQVYAIQSIPYTVLIDKEGKIIATDLRGADLDKKLSEVLK